MQSEPRIHSPLSRRNLCPRPVLWWSQPPVCTFCNSHQLTEHWCLNATITSHLAGHNKLTINERQKRDQAFSSMLDEVRWECPSQKTVEALKGRVEELMASGQSALSQDVRRVTTSTQQGSEVKETPCANNVEESGARKPLRQWRTLRANATWQVAVGTGVMLCRKSDTRSWWTALGTVISIKAYHITVQFDALPCREGKGQVCSAEECVCSVPTHPGICRQCAQVAGSVCHRGPVQASVLCIRVTCETKAELALECIWWRGSAKCLQEINRSRETYRPDLPQYSGEERHCTEPKTQDEWQSTRFSNGDRRWHRCLDRW